MQNEQMQSYIDNVTPHPLHRKERASLETTDDERETFRKIES